MYITLPTFTFAVAEVLLVYAKLTVELSNTTAANIDRAKPVIRNNSLFIEIPGALTQVAYTTFKRNVY